MKQLCSLFRSIPGILKSSLDGKLMNGSHLSGFPSHKGMGIDTGYASDYALCTNLHSQSCLANDIVPLFIVKYRLCLLLFVFIFYICRLDNKSTKRDSRTNCFIVSYKIRTRGAIYRSICWPSLTQSQYFIIIILY